MNLATFAERVLRRPLWAHQVEAVASDRFVTAPLPVDLHNAQHETEREAARP